MAQCEHFSNDVKHWAEYRTGEYISLIIVLMQYKASTYFQKYKYMSKYLIWILHLGIKEFRPWLESSEKKAKEGLTKPSTLEEANSLYTNVKSFEQGCLQYLKILEDAEGASIKMTTHKEADDEVKVLKERYF